MRGFGIGIDAADGGEGSLRAAEGFAEVHGLLACGGQSIVRLQCGWEETVAALMNEPSRIELAVEEGVQLFGGLGEAERGLS
ncbi:cobaltochelatase subunit CobN [Actinomadura verrucosospora]|uniref:Cobaltochelatase subunit CobN n=1 Tax=Actinomadura verrucosospora TaxID=46165 RepID=A0A7D3ZVP1_ACTVE|nr:cobaltochelatase subunit CobN [Actinomadura verrucosospora]